MARDTVAAILIYFTHKRTLFSSSKMCYKKKSFLLQSYAYETKDTTMIQAIYLAFNKGGSEWGRGSGIHYSLKI